MKKLLLVLAFLFVPASLFAQNSARMISGTNVVPCATPYTIQKQDVTKLDVFVPSTGTCNVTLPSGTTGGYGKGAIFSVKNNSTTFVVIITPVAPTTIDKNSSLTLSPGQGADIYSDGVNYETQPGSGSGNGAPQNYNTVQDENGTKTQRPILRFANTLCVDNAGNFSTDCSFSYQGIQVAGVAQPIEPVLNFLNNTSCADNPGVSTNCTLSAFYQTVQNNAVSLTQRATINVVPPLLATDNGANTRTDISCPVYVGVGGSHSAGCMIDPGATGSGTDYPGRDAQWHTSVSAATVKPDPSTAAMWVAATCNGGSACADTNDGLSWGTAKLTLYNAACSLPGGNCGTQTAGAGTIFVGPNPTFNSTLGAGLWLMGSTDPNYAAPPVGWLKFTNTSSLNVIGVPNTLTGPNGHKPTVLVNFGTETDRVHPAVWLSDVVAGFYMSDFHFQYMGRAVVIGECSNGDRTGTCGSQSVILENVSALLNQTASNGPCTDIASNVFWIWMRDGGCGGNAYTATGAPTSDNSAAVLLDGSAGSGSGLVYVVDYQMAGGGIKVKQGSNGASLYARNVIEEGDFTHPLPPAVWFTAWSQSMDAVLDNVQTADGGANSLNAIQNDGDPSGIYGGPTVINSNGVTGSANVINQTNQTTNLTTQSPAVQRQSGNFNNYLVGRTDIARRMLDLVSVRFNNLVFSNPVGWTGIVIPTANLPDPFGGTLAEKIANSSAAQATATLGPNTPYTPTAGDWLIGGVWAQGLAQTGDSLVISATGLPVPTYSTNIKNRGMQVGDGQWQFLSQVSKVASGSATSINLQVKYTNTVTPTLYGPVLYIIPAGTLSDSEVVEFANAMNSVDNNCTIGSICNIAGHPISADSFTERTTILPNPTGSVGITQFYMDSTTNWPSFKPNGNTAYSTAGFLAGTPVNSDCVKWIVAGGITTLGDAGAACGSGGGGGGTVSPGLLNSLTMYTGAGIGTVVGPVPSIPVTPASVTQFVTYTPNGTVSGAPSVQLAGIPVRLSNTSPSDTVAPTDRNSLIYGTFGGGVTLNAPSTLFNNGFAFKVSARSLNSNYAVTPTSPATCNGAAACNVLQGQNSTFTLDSTGTNLIADIHDPPLTCVTGCTLARGDYSLGLSITGAVSGTGTNGSLAKFTGTTSIGNADLAGDVTTSGTTTTTVGAVNGVTYQAGGALATNRVPVTTGTGSTTYQQVPAAAITGGGVTTVNNQACTIGGSDCDVNSGAANHTLSINKGASAAITGLALTVNQIPVGVSSADPAAGNLSELSATISGADSSGGSTTAYAACSTPAASTTLHSGQFVSFKVVNSNTSNNPTLAWCGSTATTVTSIGGAVLANGDMKAGQIAFFMYDGTNFELQNPQTNILGTAVRWDTLPSAAANATYNNAAFTTTFNQTSNVNWTWNNATAATSGTSLQPAPQFMFEGQYWNGASAQDTWRMRAALGNGTNGTSTFAIEHTGGTSGAVAVQVPNLNTVALNATGLGTFSAAGAASTPGLTVTGAPFATGTGTTNQPQLYVNSGSSPSTWSTSGTAFGINGPSGFVGNMLDFHLNGGTSTFKVDYQGAATLAATLTTTGVVSSGAISGTTISGTGLGTFSAAGAASTPGFTVTGAPFTGGTATTNFPQLYVNDGTGPTTFSTAGTEFGINTPNAFTGNLLDAHVNGGASVFSVNYQGNGTLAGTLSVTGHVTLEGVTSAGATGTGNLVFATSPTLTTPALGAATATSLLATGNVDGTAPVTITTGASATLGGTFKSGYTFNQNATAATAITYTLPTAAAGLQYCVGNSYNGSAATTGTLEILTSASGQFIIFTDGTLSATGGFVQSGGAAADAACVVGVDSTHWQLYVSRGTWTKH